MGLFDFAADIVSATVKIALTPLAVVKDAVSVVTGEDADATKELLKSAGDDVTNSIDDLME